MKRLLLFIIALFLCINAWSQEYKAKKQNDKYGYVNSADEWVINPQFDYAENFKNGKGIVKRNGYYGVINKTGSKIIDFIYNYISINEDGYFSVEKDKKYGLFDNYGNEIIPCRYSVIYYHDVEQVYKVNINENGKELKGLYNKEGKEIFPCKFKSIIYDEKVQAYRVYIEENGKEFKGLYNKEGEEIFPCKFKSIIYDEKEQAYNIYIEENGKDLNGLYSKDGKEIFPCKFKSIIYDDEEQVYKIYVEENGKDLMGLYSKDGKEIFPCKYSLIFFYEDSYHVKMHKNGIELKGLFSKDGIEILPCKYQSIVSFGNYYKTELNDVEVYYDLSGNEIPDPFKSLKKEKGVELSGNWSFNVNYSKKNVKITGDKIENKAASGKSGTLKIQLCVTENKYTGGSITGYILTDYTFDQLESGYYYHDISKILDFYCTPPEGTYFVTLFLLEYGNEYYIKDYLTFDTKLTFDYSDERLQDITNALLNAGNVLNNLNNLQNNSQQNNNSVNQNNSNSSVKLVRVPCSYCKGTGINPSATTVAAFGSTEQHWCEHCKSWVSATHGAHLKNCPSCGGKGYNEKYKP